MTDSLRYIRTDSSDAIIYFTLKEEYHYLVCTQFPKPDIRVPTPEQCKNAFFPFGSGITHFLSRNSAISRNKIKKIDDSIAIIEAHRKHLEENPALTQSNSST